MPMQVRMMDPVTKEEFSFSPARCVERWYPQVIETAIKGCLKGAWEPWFSSYLEANGVTEEVLLKTLRAFSVFVDLSLEPDIKTVREALDQSGFFACPVPAQMIVLAKIGQLCAGDMWSGIRHSTMQGMVPEPVKMMRETREQLDGYITGMWNATAQRNQHASSSPPPSGAGTTESPARCRSGCKGDRAKGEV